MTDYITNTRRAHLATIGAKGGSVKSPRKAASSRANGLKAKARTIQDEFSGEPDRRKRYQLRQAKKRQDAP